MTEVNEKPLLGGAGLRELIARIEYHALDLVQAPFSFVFWKIEQCKARLRDQLANEENDR
jgi:hypothetical protein